MRNNEHTIVGDLLASAKGIDGLFTQIQSLQAHLGRARTTGALAARWWCDTPNMGTRFERGGHGQRDGAFRNRITCAIRKLWLVKFEIPLKRPENPETPENPENPENCDTGVPTTAGALYVRCSWRLPRGAAYWALARGLLLEPRHLGCGLGGRWLGWVEGLLGRSYCYPYFLLGLG